MLVTRVTAQWIAGLGLLQALFATGLAVCGFVTLGLFHNLDCIGIWIGLPMLVPGILSIVVLATRKTHVSALTCATSVIVLGFGIYHAFEVFDDIDYWKKYRRLAETGTQGGILANPCYDQGSFCSCTDIDEYNSKGYTVQFCDQFRLGEELFWAMFVLTLGGLLFSLLNAITTLWGALTGVQEEKGSSERNGRTNVAYSN